MHTEILLIENGIGSVLIYLLVYVLLYCSFFSMYISYL